MPLDLEARERAALKLYCDMELGGADISYLSRNAERSRAIKALGVTNIAALYQRHKAAMYLANGKGR